MKIGYARVSKEDDQDAGAQIAALKRAGCKKVFTDNLSAASARRPQLEKALAAVSAGDHFIVWKVDRLSRSLLQLMQLMLQLDRAGVSFRSLREPVNTTTPIGRALLQLLGIFAELELSMIRERTKLGLAHARRHGRAGGNRRKLTDDQVAHAVVLLESDTVRRVARSLQVSRSTLNRELKNFRARRIVAALKQGATNGKTTRSQGKKAAQRRTGARRNRR